MSRPPTIGLTETQYRLMKAISEYIAQNRMSPSSRELQATLGYKSQTAVHQAMMAMEKKGFIEHQILNGRRVARTVAVTRAGARAVKEHHVG